MYSSPFSGLVGYRTYKECILLLFGVGRLPHVQVLVIKGECFAIPADCPTLLAGWRSR